MIGSVVARSDQRIKFEGYAQCFDAAIAALQFSCDEGATWTSYAIENPEPDANVNWTFSLPKLESGRYRLLVRAIDVQGSVTPEPACVPFEVEL